MSTRTKVSATNVKPFGSAGSKKSSDPAAPASAPAAAHAAAHAAPLAGGGAFVPPHPAVDPSAAVHPPAAGHPPAAATAPKKECAAFKAGKQCKHKMGCFDEQCRAKTAAESPSSSKPATKTGPGDGGVAQRLAQMEKSITDIASRVDNVGAKVDAVGTTVEQGFQAQSLRTTELMEQAASVHLQNMQMFQALGAAFAGGISAIRGDFSSRPALIAPEARLAICAGSSSESSERRTATAVARGGAASCNVTEINERRVTGTDLDNVMSFLGKNGLSVNGFAYNCIMRMLEKSPFSDHHMTIIGCIAPQTKNDPLVTLLFMLLTGSEQFQKLSTFADFRTACAVLLGANRTNTQATFSMVCKGMIAKNPNWEIKKSGVVKASNAMLKDPAQHQAAFDTLVANFKNPF